MKRLFVTFTLLISSQVVAADLNGAGSSFVAPLYQKMFQEYQKQTGVSVEYDPVGSGKGQRAIIERRVDFGASDVWLSRESQKAAPGKLMHIPITVGAVVPVYNLPGLTEALLLDGNTLAEIYLGRVTRWDDRLIKRLNPRLKLPDLPITVIYREDASGTTRIFTDYLSTISAVWHKQVGESGMPKWPVGVGVNANIGMAAQVAKAAGSIGYMDLSQARQSNLAYAKMVNRRNNIVEATNQSSAAAVKDIDLDRLDRETAMNDSDDPQAYPIVGLSYLLIYQNQQYGKRTEAQARNLVKLVRWMLTNGQSYSEGLNYAKLPPELVDKALRNLADVTYGATALK